MVRAGIASAREWDITLTYISYIAIATHQIQNVDVLVGQYAHDLLFSHGQKSSDDEALCKTTTRARVGRESEGSQKEPHLHTCVAHAHPVAACC